MTYSNYHSCRDALRVPEYSHICVTNQALASKQKIQTDEDRKQKLVNGLHKQLAVSRSKVLIRFSEFFIHDPKKNNLFSSLCLLEDWIIQEIEVDGASTRELTSDALVLSTMVMASATVSRKASGPRRSTIPAIVNVFLGPGRRCVINNPTPRFYNRPQKRVRTRQVFRNAFTL